MRRRPRLAPVWVHVALAGLAVLAAPARTEAARSEADRLFMVGAGSFEDGLYETAYRELGRFIQAAPTDPRRGDAAFLRGKAAFWMERYAEALVEFDAAETFPLNLGTSNEVIFWQGETLFRLRRFEEARDRYARFLGLKPASPLVPEALYARGLAELETGRADGAVDTLRDFLREYPTHARAPTAAYSAARELIRARRWEDALALLTPYAARYPGSPYLAETRYLLGVAQVEAGRPEGVRTLEQFIAQNSGSELVPTARALVAEAQVKAGRPREALEQYQALVRAAPTAQGLYRIGELSLRLNRPSDAEAAWTTLRRDFPEDALAGPAGLATARLHEQRKQWEPALQLAQSVASMKGPERSDALLLVGQSALQLRRNAEAAQAYHAVVVETTPASKRYFEGLAGLAAALEAATDKEGASRAYREIVDTSPDPELVRWAKGRLGALEAPAPAPRAAPKAKPKPKRSGAGG
ncbi:MAG TPA: tetratricopeptide repeat protein [Methylomirabilota bacterium]|jgi:TolA-binding protein|nr:tetratricopeptide repeat protein [Methylomirabilota bacterium]